MTAARARRTHLRHNNDNKISVRRHGEVDTFAMASPGKVPGLVESAGLVVESVDARQRRQHRDLALALSPAPGPAAGEPHLRYRAHALPLCRLCVRLRIQ